MATADFILKVAGSGFLYLVFCHLHCNDLVPAQQIVSPGLKVLHGAE